MRTPVKLPGPRPIASASRSRAAAPPCRSSASTSSSSVTARETRSPSTSPSSTSALVATFVAVSKATVSTVDRNRPAAVFSMTQTHRYARGRQHSESCLRPLDERDRPLEIRLEIPPLRSRHALKAIQVEMRDLDAVSVVAVADRERRARDAVVHAERATRTADERRLPRSELAGHGDDVTTAELCRDACS